MRKRGMLRKRLIKGSAAGLACAAVLMGMLSSAAPAPAALLPGNPGAGGVGGGPGVESPGEHPGPEDEPGIAPQDDRGQEVDLES